MRDIEFMLSFEKIGIRRKDMTIEARTDDNEAQTKAYLEDLYVHAINGDISSKETLSSIALGGSPIAQEYAQKMDDYFLKHPNV